MSSIIKNQILKHLTKFFKNLAPEQLQMNALMGSCELSNLQLNEVVLMDLMELPVWLTITSAVVDKIYIKISWTKIKSVPIQMHLNEVSVEIKVCDEFRNPDGEKTDLSQYLNLNQQPSKYGFVDKTIDGITVVVNNVNVSFKSKLMAATFNLSRVTLESRCPNWKQGELSLTKLKDVKKGHVLLFKVCEWHTMRLEAKSLTDPDQAPLRLLTNYAQCRLTIKKKLSDCSVVAARIFVIFEDILWILTFAQFVSASAFVEYIFSLIKRSPMSTKNETLTTATGTSSFNQASLISPYNTPSKPVDKRKVLTGNLSTAEILEEKLRMHDIIETSMHLFIEKVDAHLYDDIEPQKNDANSGGAIQLTLSKIQVDCYPYSRVISDRKHWYNWFDPSPNTRKQWVNNHLSQFDKLRATKPSSDDLIQEQRVSASCDERLLSLTVLFKIKEFCMNCVATNSSTTKGSLIKKFIEIDKDYHMPADMPSLYLELNYFYYFDSVKQMMIYEDVPDPLTFIHLSPTKLLFDTATILFLNSFYANLSKAIINLNELFPQDTTPPKIHIRIEVLMPQVSLPAKFRNNNDGTASKLLIKSGKIILSNSLYDNSVMQKLTDTIELLNKNSPTVLNFNSKNTNDLEYSVWDLSIIEQARAELSPTKQLWAFQFEPLWLDFMNCDNEQQQSVSFKCLQPIVEPVKVYVFIHINLRALPQEEEEKEKEEAKQKESLVRKADTKSPSKQDVVSILVALTDEPLIANLDKTEFRFLRRFFSHLDKFLQQMKADISNIIKLEHVTEDTLDLHLAAYIKDIKTKVLFDKNLIESDNCDDINCDDENNSKNHSNEGQTSDSVIKSDIYSNNKDQQQSTRSAIVSTSLSSRSELDAMSFRDQLESSSNYVPSVVTVQDEGSLMQVLDASELDECTEVADDATCLLLDESNLDELLSSKQAELNAAEVCNNEMQKSNILNDIEESSKLFEKVQIASRQQQESKSLNTEQQKQRQQQQQTDQSAYFELALSQLVFKTNALTSRFKN